MKSFRLFRAIILILTLAGGTVFAQPLTGTKTIPGNYATIAAAIADLNTNGVGSGGVTFDVTAGLTETFPSLTAGLITATGTASNPIVFQKSGAGADPLITAFSPGASTTADFIIAIAGGDYITFDGIDVQENASNTTPTQQMEWGYALVKRQNVTPFDGCQFVVIKNSTITLNRSNTASYGIYVNNHIITSNAALTITATSDAHNNNSFYNNTISNCYNGIYIRGFSAASPYTLYDQNNQVGVGGGNSITNYGGGAVSSFGICANFQNNLKEDNNTISSASGTAAVLFGIVDSTGTSSSVEIYNNTVTVVGGGTTQAVFGINNLMGGTPTSNTVTIRRNTVQNCTYTTATSGNLTGIQTSGGGYTFNLDSNTVNNLSKNVNTTGTLTGINSAASAVNLNVVANTVSNLSMTGTTGSGTMQGIIHSGSGITSSTPGTFRTYGNTVFNFTSPRATVMTGLSVTPGNISNPCTLIDDSNTIYGFSSAGGSLIGIQVSNAGPIQYIHHNNVYDLGTAGSGSVTPGALGYTFSTFGGSVYVYDNFCSDLRATTSTSAAGVVGMQTGNGDATTTYRLYDNTIYLNATGGTNFGSAGVNNNNPAAIVELRNNAIINNSTPDGTGKTVAYRVSTSYTSVTYSGSSNNNDFYAGTPGASNLVFLEAAQGSGAPVPQSAQTVAAFQAVYAPLIHDQGSFSELPPFVNAAGHDLHINASVATQLESGALPVSTPQGLIANDIDGDARNATYPDVGADEFSGIASDLVPPGVSYTPFAVVSPTPQHTLTATIFDPSGVPTSGAGLPVVYWKINSTGTYTGATGSYSGGTQYSFTFGSGASVGDTVYYFLCAQDNAPSPNVGATPPFGAAGFTSNPPAVSTPTSLPYAYRIVAAPLSGDYTIGGASPSYATIKAAVTDLNTRGVNGAVRFLLSATAFTESTPDTIKIISDSLPAASRTVTFKPNTGIVATISGSLFTDGLFDIFSSFIIIDGNNGDGNRDLSLTNTNGGNSLANTYVVGFLNGGGSYTPTNCAIKNCTLTGGASTVNYSSTLTFGIYAPGGGYDNIVIDNNVIAKIRTGIQFAGLSGAVAHNAQITNSTIGSIVDNSSCFIQGISASYTDNLLISNNEILGEVAGNGSGGIGISILTGSTNSKIRKNKIHDFFNNGTSSGGTQGICIDPGTSINTGITEISNNMIYNLKGDCNSENVGTASMGAVTQGIWVNSTGLAPVQMYYNTIYLSGTCLGTQTSGRSFNGSSSCIGLRGGSIGAGAIDIRNNILKNSQQPVTPNPTDNQTMAIWVQAASSTNVIFGNIDDNDYNIDGNFPQIGYLTGAFSATLTAWQTATGKDAHSVTVAPAFVSASDLHLTAPSIGDHNLAGTPISGITTDIDGDTRDDSAPYMGIDEIPGSPLHALRANVKVFLQGPYNSGTNMMDNTLKTGGILAAYFSGAVIPANAVDSINIEIRDNPTSAGSTIRQFQPAWLLADGTIRNFTDTTKAYTEFTAPTSGSYYIVISHRNHLAIMSATASALTGLYDFTTSQAQAYGTNPMIQVGASPSVFAMYAGDANASGIVTSSDANGVFSSLLAAGYNANDINLSGVVSTADANLVFTNLLIGSQVSRPGEIREEIMPATSGKSTVPPGRANKTTNH